MTVFFRKDKRRWVVSYQIRIGEWRQKLCPPTITTKRQAETWEAKFVASHLEDGSIVPTRSTRDEPTIAELAQRWQELRASNPILARSTVLDEAQRIRSRVLPAFGTRHLSTLTTSELREWVRTIRNDLAANTCKTIVNTFACMAEDAIAEEWVDLRVNPIKHPGVKKEIPHGRNVSREIIHLTLEQARQLISCNSVDPSLRARYAVALTTGLRDGELSGLQWRDIDLTSTPPRLTVARSLSIRTRKMSRVKSEASARTVPLHPLAAHVLTLWLPLCEILTCKTPTGEVPVFPGGKGQAYRHDHAPKLLRQALETAGLPVEVSGQPITAHATRRSFATWLSDQGVEESTIALLLGHAGSSTVARHYSAATIERLYKAISRIELCASIVPSLVPGGHKEK